MAALLCLNEGGMELFDCQSGWKGELVIRAPCWTGLEPRENCRAERDTGIQRGEELVVPLTAKTGFKHATHDVACWE